MSDQGYPRQGGKPGQHGQPEHGEQPPRQPEYAQQNPGPDGTVQHPGAGDPARFAAVPPQSPTRGYPPPGGAGEGGRKKGLIAGIGALVLAGTGGYPPPGGAGGGRHKKGLIAGIGALVVAGIVVLLVAGVSSSDASVSPRDQVKKWFEAEQTHDVFAAVHVLCAADQGQAVRYVGRRPHELKGLMWKSFTVNFVWISGNAGAASLTASDNTRFQASWAVLLRKEGGTWKVCPEPYGPNSNARSNGPSASRPSIGSGGINPCQHASSVGNAAATFVSLIASGDVDLAQGCVADGAVPPTATESLVKVGIRDPININAGQVRGDVVTYRTLSGQHVIKVKVRKSGSGYEITGLSVR